MASIKLKTTTTVQISLKTKRFLDELKEKEQLSNYDAVIRILLLNYKLFKEISLKDHQEKKKDQFIKNT